MNIITQKFKKLSKEIIFSMKKKEIKSILQRDRLKFSNNDIMNYVCFIFEHSVVQKTIKSMYKNMKKENITWLKNLTYHNLLKNIRLFSKLFKYLFNQINKKLLISPSKLLNMVDTTLIPEKQAKFIHQKDWKQNRVTTRVKDNITTHVCGSKGLIFMNKFNQIYHAELVNINYSDHNFFKDSAYYFQFLKGILLADSGFSCKEVRHRLENYFSNMNSIFKQKEKLHFISPYHYKQKLKLNQKESKLYKYRWRIETLFQNIKHNYSNNKLNLSGNYSKSIKQAKFYSTLIQYNFSTT